MTYSKDDFHYYKFDIASIKNFITKEEADSVIKYLNLPDHPWGTMPFFQSLGMGFGEFDDRLPELNLPNNFFSILRERFRESAETLFDRKLKPNTSHAQVWYEGGHAAPHSDGSDLEGNLNAFQINKYVGILYLNDDYDGGELYFPDHNIEISPEACEFIIFPGGHENIHGVKNVLNGIRYTLVAFWDYAEAEYSEEIKKQWEEEIKELRIQQEKQREEWAQFSDRY